MKLQFSTLVLPEYIQIAPPLSAMLSVKLEFVITRGPVPWIAPPAGTYSEEAALVDAILLINTQLFAVSPAFIAIAPPTPESTPSPKAELLINTQLSIVRSALSTNIAPPSIAVLLINTQLVTIQSAPHQQVIAPPSS